MLPTPCNFTVLREHSDCPELFQEVRLAYFGWQQCDPGYTWTTDIEGFYLIHGVVAGRGTLRLNGATHVVRPGQAFLLTEQDEATYWADNRDPWQYVFFAFDGPLASTLLERTVFARQDPLVPVDAEQMAALCRELWEQLDESDTTLAGQQALMALLRLFIPAREGRALSAAQRHVRQALSYIRLHYTQPLTVSQLAATLYVDRSYLCRAFQAHMGRSPREYIQQVRLERAAHWLRTTDRSLSDVALAVGFDSYSTFYRAFCAHYGQTPSAYRRAAL